MRLRGWKASGAEVGYRDEQQLHGIQDGAPAEMNDGTVVHEGGVEIKQATRPRIRGNGRRRDQGVQIVFIGIAQAHDPRAVRHMIQGRQIGPKLAVHEDDEVAIRRQSIRRKRRFREGWLRWHRNIVECGSRQRIEIRELPRLHLRGRKSVAAESFNGRIALGVEPSESGPRKQRPRGRKLSDVGLDRCDIDTHDQSSRSPIMRQPP